MFNPEPDDKWYADLRDEAKAMSATRRKITRRLNSWGFKRLRAKGGSAYFEKATVAGKLLRVRVSDHAVPLTEAREFALSAGQFSWAASGFQLRLDCETRMEIGRTLVRIRRQG